MNRVGTAPAQASNTLRAINGKRSTWQQAVAPLVCLMSLIAFVLLVLAGCAAVPAYQEPLSILPSRWQAILPDDDDNPSPCDWWGNFGDPAVATLVGWTDKNSPTLDKALTQIAFARATLQLAGAALEPAMTLSAAAQRGRSATAAGDIKSQTAQSASIDASWEFDLFGKPAAGAEGGGVAIGLHPLPKDRRDRLRDRRLAGSPPGTLFSFVPSADALLSRLRQRPFRRIRSNALTSHI